MYLHYALGRGLGRAAPSPPAAAEGGGARGAPPGRDRGGTVPLHINHIYMICSI